MYSIPQDLGERLALDAGDLATGYVGGDAMALAGTESVTARCAATFDASTTLTSIEFRWEKSDDDGVTWDPIAGVRKSDGAVVDKLQFLAASGSAADDLETTSHREHARVRLAARHTGGSPSGDDAATGSVRFLS